jgi:dTDP-4-amino-4,6-dideoxygalactose transaminase
MCAEPCTNENPIMHIPFLDLVAQHRALEEELVAVFRSALRTASFIGGEQVQKFEEEFAQFCGTKFCVGVNSGTDALRFALMAAGIGPGDQVITVPNTFIATTEAISQVGAMPVFVDIDERTYNLDPNKLESYLKNRFALSASHPVSSQKRHALRSMRSALRPRAVIPVHLYGQPAEMDSVLEIADRHGLIVIEDACQAHGAEYFSGRDNQWKKAGSMGMAAAFSFYPGKNLGACGEAGAVTTNDEEIACKIRMIRDHGQAKKYLHGLEGYNGRLDAVQAGILRIKLQHLPDWNERRRKNASQYNDLLSALDGIITHHEPSWSRAVYHLYVIRARQRDELQKYLSEHGVATGLHYPIPLHLQKAYLSLGHKQGDFPLTERIASEVLSLPMYPELTYVDQRQTVGKIQEFLSERS